ncbi:S41 family peptidase [Lysobacter sp. Root667]|uniref:S41 family peptidase n=1 Tax=Lysobacter sp. Root667 TaxID=1736581 RepID=UPI0009EC1B75|nr:S41 family peptidase [Lysobacter sp. Root667]
MGRTYVRGAVAAGGGLLAVGILLFGVLGRAEPGPPPQRDMAVDAAMRREVIAATVASLDRAYVFPDKATAMGAYLRNRLQRGDFDTITSAEEFARTLTEALREQSHDLHLELRYVEQPVPMETPGQAAPAGASAEETTKQRRLNFGVSTVGRLPGNLGYIDLHQFGRPVGATPRIAAAMDLVSDTAALVLDLRKCGGGDPDTVMAFASYLFDRPTHLNDVYWRDENRTERRWTQPQVAGTRYGQARKIYLLTSGDTFSGCEDLAYALKNNRRATLIGETTGGGAHAGSPQRLTAHFMMFVPSGRPINPITHTDWEGVGVVPDIKVPAEQALDVAQVAALEAIIPGERDRQWRSKLQERVDELK